MEEALLVSSVGFVCTGIVLLLSGGSSSTAEIFAPLAGLVLSLWIWHRFGLNYFFLAAMIFAGWLAVSSISSATALHITVALLYTAALLPLVMIRPRHRLTYLDQRYSIAEALLWFGIYLAINLQLSDPTVSGQGWFAAPASSAFSKSFYWTTLVLIWCLPPLVLARGLRLKDRFVIGAGGISAILTLITNRLYVGGVQHTWDPMLLGAFLIGIALLIRRWLAQGQNEVRRGFTAKRLSGKDKEWLNTATTALGVVAPGAIASTQQTTNSDVHFGGGDSGGAGASSEW